MNNIKNLENDDDLIKEINKLIENAKLLINVNEKFSGKKVQGQQIRTYFQDLEENMFNIFNYSLKLDGRPLKTKVKNMRGNYGGKNKKPEKKSFTDSNSENKNSSDDKNEKKTSKKQSKKNNKNQLRGNEINNSDSELSNKDEFKPLPTQQIFNKSNNKLDSIDEFSDIQKIKANLQLEKELNKYIQLLKIEKNKDKIISYKKKINELESFKKITMSNNLVIID